MRKRVPTAQEIRESRIVAGTSRAASRAGQNVRDTLVGLVPKRRQKPVPEIGDDDEEDGAGDDETEDAGSQAEVEVVDPIEAEKIARREARKARRAAKLRLKRPVLEPPPPAWDPELWSDENAAIELHTAALQNDALRVRFLLHGLEVSRCIPADIPNDAGESAAVCAARAGCAVSCAALLDGGANPLARDKDPKNFGDGVWPQEGKPAHPGKSSVPNIPNGRTVIYHLRCLNILDEVLGRVFPTTRVDVVNAIAEQLSKHYEAPPMVVAIRHDNPQLLKLLLTQSATFPENMHVITQSISEESTPRTDASTPRTASVILQAPAARALVRNSMKDRDGRAVALLKAVQQRRWTCAEVLLESGVPRATLDTVADANGRNALHFAAVEGEASMVRLLLGKGASHSLYSKIGRQPIHDAAALGYVDVVSALIQGKADVLAKTREAQDLRSLDAKPQKRGGGGQTAFEIAEAKGKTAVCAVLQPKEEAAMERRATMPPQAFAARDTWVSPATQRQPMSPNAASWHTRPVVMTVGANGSPLFGSRKSPLTGSQKSPLPERTLQPRPSVLGSSSGQRSSLEREEPINLRWRGSSTGSRTMTSSSRQVPAAWLDEVGSPSQRRFSMTSSSMATTQRLPLTPSTAATTATAHRRFSVSSSTTPHTLMRSTKSVGHVSWGPLASAGKSTLASSRMGSVPARGFVDSRDFATAA